MLYTNGEGEFRGSKDDWDLAAQIAEKCVEFKADDEDEMVADEAVSCYNCRYRRWTVRSFVCLNKAGFIWTV
ncbi:MAG: hypothetical protein PHQ94_01840 [Syntrophomonas sp.]|nr:hypothetical protein [Syntrophomonas sp.]